MLKDILAISGKPGLYKFISQGRNGVIVESLEDGKRMNAFTTAKVSSLEDIAIYTIEEEIPLADIFKKISEKENGGECISHKSSPDELKKYFLTILPEYDDERVYVSDIKKVMQWYNMLHKYNLLNFEEEEKKEKEEKEKEVDKGKDEKAKKSPSTKKPEDKGVKKATPKKTTKSNTKSTTPKKTATPKQAASRKTTNK